MFSVLSPQPIRPVQARAVPLAGGQPVRPFSHRLPKFGQRRDRKQPPPPITWETILKSANKELQRAKRGLNHLLARHELVAMLDALGQALSDTREIMDRPDRVALQRRIADKLYGEGARKKERRADIVAGIPGAGKSTLVKTLVRKYGSLVADPDDAKAYLEESHIDPDMLGLPHWGRNHLNAFSTVQEGHRIRDMIMDKAFEHKDNLILPIVGRKIEYTRKSIDRLRTAGYEIHYHHVELPLHKAIGRVIKRLYESGRYVSPDYLINQVGFRPRANYFKIRKLFESERLVDGYSAWSNDVPMGEPLVLLERRLAEKDFSILDRRLDETETPAFQEKITAEFDQAKAYLKRQLALGNTGFVVLDVDDTVLDHRPYYRDPGKQYHRHPDRPDWWVTWQSWVKRAEAPAIPQAKVFIEWLEARNIPYCYVTGRIEKEKDDTVRNLSREGLIGENCRGVYCKPDTYWKGTTQGEKKTIRERLARELGMPVLASVGDRSADMTDEPEKNFLLSCSQYRED